MVFIICRYIWCRSCRKVRIYLIRGYIFDITVSQGDNEFRKKQDVYHIKKDFTTNFTTNFRHTMEIGGALCTSLIFAVRNTTELCGTGH